MRAHRAVQTDEQRAHDRANAASGMRAHRAGQTDEQRARDRANAALRMRRFREYTEQLRAWANTQPVGLQCNMDIFDPSSVEYFNVGATIDGVHYALKDAVVGKPLQENVASP